MPGQNKIAQVNVNIKAPVERVWNALTDPEMIRQYMPGTTVESAWEEGSTITWKGVWKGKTYEDKGILLQVKPRALLQYSHYSPREGQQRRPENDHIVTINLKHQGHQTHIMLTQDHNASDTERRHSEENWNIMLLSLKKLLEH
jgi:uncharacterized protein YndB with AHSA1/START domain